MKRPLGSLTSADLGRQVTGMPTKPVRGMPKARRAVTGRLEHVSHFRIGSEDHTRCIVWVVRTQKEVDDREPDHREIGGLCNEEIEVHDRG